jgi:hypothetical protein
VASEQRVSLKVVHRMSRGIESDERLQLLLPEDLAGQSRAARRISGGPLVALSPNWTRRQLVAT